MKTHKFQCPGYVNPLDTRIIHWRMNLLAKLLERYICMYDLKGSGYAESMNSMGPRQKRKIRILS